MKPTEKIETATFDDGSEMALLKHDRDFVITLNGHVLMSSRQHESEFELARLGCTRIHRRKDPVVLIGGLGMSMGNIAATSLLTTLVGLVFGALALALSAGTGRVSVAVYATVGVALILYVLNALLPFNDALVGWAKVSPFYYYLSSDPLMNGMDWAHGAVLTGLTVILVGIALVLFQRRDLRQSG